jgi:transcription antitermination factor NusG
MQTAVLPHAQSRLLLEAEWYAAYVKHQHEKKVAELLERKGIEVFLPCQQVSRRWADRNKYLVLPLFPGYVFVRSNLGNKFQMLSTPGVFFMVENAGRACAIPVHEIDSIRRIVEAGVPVKAHPFVTSGDAVRICSGSLSGIIGILDRFKNQYRVILTVQALQKALSVEVEVSNIERIGEGPNSSSRDSSRRGQAGRENS